MEEIKSVRIRRKDINFGSLDIKVTISEDRHTFGSNDMILSSSNNGEPVWLTSRYKISGIFKEYTPDQFIESYISTNSKQENSLYEIIQNPWEENVPIWRSYGFDPYYLNNGSSVVISWLNGTKVAGGKKYSDNNGNELSDSEKEFITKSIKIFHSSEKELITLNKNDIFEKTIYSKDFGGLVKDIDILNLIISKWNTIVPSYELSICDPNNISCSLIEYKSPISPDLDDKQVDKPISSITKEKVNMVLPNTDIKVKEDITLKVYIGEVKEDIKKVTVDDFIYGEPIVYDEDDEYYESSFDGEDEVEFDIQEQVSNNQEDNDSNLSQIGTAANIKPVSGLDQLLKLAGDCARELGKKDRVNYKNLSSGYIKGIHGLCPQGTLSVLYAMTGIKSLGMLRGNANSFAMNGYQGFTSGGYYNQKVKVGKEYFNNKNSWQIGDIIANDYTNGKKYGHIQIWTGIKWVSDFTQKQLQINNVDFNTVALHRLTPKGIEVVNKQTS